MLDPKDGVSNANSVMSSTLVQDGASQSHGGSHIIQESKGHDKSGRNGQYLKHGGLLSDPCINPDELDENVARKSTYHRRRGSRQAAGPQVSCDLTVPPEPRRQIYKITNEFPVARPYSTPVDWQKILARHSIQQQTVINDKPVDPNDDGLAESLLNLPNRNWIRD